MRKIRNTHQEIGPIINLSSFNFSEHLQKIRSLKHRQLRLGHSLNRDFPLQILFLLSIQRQFPEKRAPRQLRRLYKPVKFAETSQLIQISSLYFCQF